MAITAIVWINCTKDKKCVAAAIIRSGEHQFGSWYKIFRDIFDGMPSG